MPHQVSDACELIIKSPAPILFIDTCIFLDILRAPFRDNIQSKEIEAAHNLIKLVESRPPNLWLVTNETVNGELDDNILLVKKELENEIKKVEEKRKKIFLSANFALNTDHQHGLKETSIELHSHLEILLRNFLAKCLVIKVEDSHSVKAMQRVRTCILPAKKGKQEAKDCEIFEAFIDIATQVRSSGFVHPICFVSSNCNDYGKPDNTSLKSEFDAINSQYVNNLQWALNIAKSK